MELMNKNRIGSFRISVICGLLLAVVTSCGNDDYKSIYNPDGTVSQNPGMFTINLKGSTITDADAKTTVILTSADNKSYAVTPSVATNIEAGTYTVTAVKIPSGSLLPEGMSVTSAGLVMEPSRSDNKLSSLPIFEAAQEELNVQYNNSITKNMALKLMTRRLIVKGSLVGADPAAIKDIDVTLSGISNVRLINGDVVTKSIIPRSDNAANIVSYYVDNATQPASDGAFNTSFNLLGINTEATQILRILVTFSNGKTYTYEQNVSTLLAGFNTSSYDVSLGLDAIINLGLDGISGTITGWIPGWDEGGMGE